MLKRVLLIISFVLLLHNTGNAAYDPPTGIPAPPFGIDETVLSEYASATYYTYYIDNTHGSMTDVDNEFGSPAKPRETIPEITYSAGDVVQVHGGPYTASGDRFNFDGAGTAEAPIFITGANAGSEPVLDEFVHFTNSQYVIFENFKIQTSVFGLQFRPLANGILIHHNAVRNCIMAGDGGFRGRQTFSVSNADYDEQVTYLVFYNNTSYGVGQYAAEVEDDSSPYLIWRKADHIWIVDNIAYDSGGDGVAGGDTAERSVHDIYIGRNILYHHRENCIDLKQVEDVIISENVCYDIVDVNTAEGFGIIVHGMTDTDPYGPKNIWIMYNKLYDLENGVIASNDSENIYIFGNLFYDIHHTGGSYTPTNVYSYGTAIHIRETTNAYVYGNTIYDYDSGIQVPNDAVNAIYIQNNIFSNRAEENGVDINHREDPTNSTMDYNLFYPGGTYSDRIMWGNGTPITLATFKTTYAPKGANCPVVSNPVFTNPGGNDFTLLPSSPTIDAGADLGDTYDDGLNPASVWPDSVATLDQDLWGAGWEIGAFVYDLYISNAFPIDGATGVNIEIEPSWTNPTGENTNDGYFKTGACPTAGGDSVWTNQAHKTSYDPGTLAESTTHCWRVDIDHDGGTETGTDYEFTTSGVPPPDPAGLNVVYLKGGESIVYLKGGGAM